MKIFSQEDLKKLAIQCADKVKNAQNGKEYFEEPFKHIVIDNFFDSELAQICLENFPSMDNSVWEHSNDADIEVKFRTTWNSEFDIPEGIVAAVRILNSSLFLKAMAEKIGIKKIVPDPYFAGGWLNVTMKGGLLDVHVDGNYHDATWLNRRLNAIVYLNPSWEESWGGEFGIYDDTWLNCIKKVPPLFNRLVIFDTHDRSFHWLPDPVNFPENEPRRSIILYYYTKESRPSEQIAVDAPHSALWVKRGLLDKRGNKTRNFQ